MLFDLCSGEIRIYIGKEPYFLTIPFASLPAAPSIYKCSKSNEILLLIANFSTPSTLLPKQSYDLSQSKKNSLNYFNSNTKTSFNVKQE